MAHFPGQASGGFVESSSALRILYVGHRNTFSAKLTTDGFTQSNPPVVTASSTVSDTLATTPKPGVLSGSVSFTRPDAGNGYVGGPNGDSPPSSGAVKPLGLFINDAEGNEYENTPAPASGQAPYVSAQGTMGSQLYETYTLTSGATNGAQGDDLVYEVGDELYGSRNGYLTNAKNSTGKNAEDTLEGQHASATGNSFSSVTTLGIVKIAPDSNHAEIVFDQRI